MDSDDGEQLNQDNADVPIPLEHLNVPNSPLPLVRKIVPEESVGSHDSDNLLTGSKRRKVKLTPDDMWKHLDKVEVTDEDGSVETKAVCKYCNESMSFDFSGASHLRRHSEYCITKITANIGKKVEPPALDNPDFVFDQAVACRETVIFLITGELSFRMGEDPAFLELTGALNPEFKPIPCRTVINVLLKFFREERPILESFLQAIPGKICLSSNLWTSNNERRYMCITAHFVDSDWKLNKKIISFPMLEDESFNMISTFEGIYNSILRWSLNEKIFTITLDNALSSDVAEGLKEALFSNASGLGKQLFCVSCGTHIFNIIVQEGLNGFHHSLKCIRKTLIHVESCADVQQKYRELCKTEGIDFKRLPPDYQLHWNTTFLMLDVALPYQRILELLLSDSSYEYIPTVLDWKNAAVMRDILKVFYESTKLCSRSKYVSSSSFFHQLSNICLVLSKYETDPSYASIIGSMKSKITKCLREIPVALGLATCMDPRCKVSFLEVCFEIIYGYEETHRPGGSLEVVRIALKELYDEYEQKLVGSLPMESTVAQEEDPTFAIFATRNRASSQSNASELQWYLDQPSIVTSNRETFDVLGWWKAQQINYPILSSMARDLLTIPVSSVPIDAAFTTSAQTLNDFRMNWPPLIVEAAACLKDWFEAEAGSQDTKLDELEDMMRDLDLDLDLDSDCDPDLDLYV